MTEQPRNFEKKLVGQRVSVRSFDWKQQLSGELVKVEKYYFILRLDSSGTIGILKHSAGGIALIVPKEE